jgi:hypothetical protein
MKAFSRVYFGDGSRRLPAASRNVATEGAQGVAIARLTPQARPVAVFANSLYYTLDSAVPARLYWGGAEVLPDSHVRDPQPGGLNQPVRPE